MPDDVGRGLVRWTGLVAAAALAAFANVAAFGPGAWATIASGLAAVLAEWVFAFAVIAAIHRQSPGGRADR